MNAPAVTIRRLSATARIDGMEAGDPGARIRRLLAGVADRRLERAIQALDVPRGTWCLRRLDVPVRLDLTAPDPAVEEAWAATLVAALAAALRNPQLSVRYDGEADALTDLVAGIATGRCERAWAWRQLDLVRPGDPEPAGAPRDLLLAALARRPQYAAGAIVRAVSRVGLPALHRTLAGLGWASLVPLLALAGGGTVDLSTASRPPAARRETADAQRLAERLLAASSFAAAARRSSLRPDAATIAAWAALVAMEVDPTVLRRRAAPAVLTAVAAALAPRPAGRDARPGSEPEEAPTAADSRHAKARGTADAPMAAGRRPGETPPAPAENAGGGAPAARGSAAAGSPLVRAPHHPPSGALPPRASQQADGTDPGVLDGWHATAHAGVFFLLATAAAAGVPDAVLDEPAFAARTLSWVLHSVAAGLGVPAADPAAAAFAGLDPGRRLPWAGEEPATAAERAGVEAVVRRWSLVTAAALCRDDDEPAAVVAGVVRRCGAIDFAPGWIEVRMPVEQVDHDVRRAGLDLDPGWVPSLGAVVRYVYE